MIAELTDGWYSIKANFCPALSRLVAKGQISVGTKLVTCGAELMGPNNATPPLEVSSDLS